MSAIAFKNTQTKFTENQEKFNSCKLYTNALEVCAKKSLRILHDVNTINNFTKIPQFLIEKLVNESKPKVMYSVLAIYKNLSLKKPITQKELGEVYKISKDSRQKAIKFLIESEFITGTQIKKITDEKNYITYNNFQINEFKIKCFACVPNQLISHTILGTTTKSIKLYLAMLLVSTKLSNSQKLPSIYLTKKSYNDYLTKEGFSFLASYTWKTISNQLNILEKTGLLLRDDIRVRNKNYNNCDYRNYVLTIPTNLTNVPKELSNSRVSKILETKASGCKNSSDLEASGCKNSSYIKDTKIKNTKTYKNNDLLKQEVEEKTGMAIDYVDEKINQVIIPKYEKLQKEKELTNKCHTLYFFVIYELLITGISFDVIEKSIFILQNQDPSKHKNILSEQLKIMCRSVIKKKASKLQKQRDKKQNEKLTIKTFRDLNLQYEILKEAYKTYINCKQLEAKNEFIENLDTFTNNLNNSITKAKENNFYTGLKNYFNDLVVFKEKCLFIL